MFDGGSSVGSLRVPKLPASLLTKDDSHHHPAAGLAPTKNVWPKHLGVGWRNQIQRTRTSVGQTHVGWQVLHRSPPRILMLVTDVVGTSREITLLAGLLGSLGEKEAPLARVTPSCLVQRGNKPTRDASCVSRGCLAGKLGDTASPPGVSWYHEVSNHGRAFCRLCRFSGSTSMVERILVSKQSHSRPWC